MFMLHRLKAPAVQSRRLLSWQMPTPVIEMRHGQARASPRRCLPARSLPNPPKPMGWACQPSAQAAWLLAGGWPLLLHGLSWPGGRWRVGTPRRRQTRVLVSSATYSVDERGVAPWPAQPPPCWPTSRPEPMGSEVFGWARHLRQGSQTGGGPRAALGERER